MQSTELPAQASFEAHQGMVLESEWAVEHWDLPYIEGLAGHTPIVPTVAWGTETPLDCFASWGTDGRVWRSKRIDAVGARRNDVVRRRKGVPVAAPEKGLDAEFVHEVLYHESGDAGVAGVGVGRLNCFAAWAGERSSLVWAQPPQTYRRNFS